MLSLLTALLDAPGVEDVVVDFKQKSFCEEFSH
jgi:hypothetical protein